MTACTLPEAPPVFGPVGADRTLDDLIVALWEEFGADRRVECPVCGGDMRPAYGAHAQAIGGTCAMCGSTMQ